MSLSKKYIGAVFTDLDGTFLKNSSEVCEYNIEALEKLADYHVARIAATGRNINSAREVIGYSLPFDFLMFSTGAGVCDYKTDNIIAREELDMSHVFTLYSYFLSKGCDFSVHFPIPENHRFYWFSPNKEVSEEMQRRLNGLKEFSHKGSKELLEKMTSATQLLAVEREGRAVEIIEEMKLLFPELSIIRATSPLNDAYVWIEVFPDGISKGESASKLCNLLGIERANTMSVGNDYNDHSMLEWTGEAFAVANAPSDFLPHFERVAANDERGFADAVDRWLKLMGFSRQA